MFWRREHKHICTMDRTLVVASRLDWKGTKAGAKGTDTSKEL